MLRFVVHIVLGMSVASVVFQLQCTRCDSLVPAVGDITMCVSTYNTTGTSLDSSIKKEQVHYPS